mmetsp:Transcript_46847/g.102443  ORF Transcript_46847/g.102443 Transcript_46847/m.102443 type:complete len:1215 (+) Transcript_46847:63-3707(+)
MKESPLQLTGSSRATKAKRVSGSFGGYGNMEAAQIRLAAAGVPVPSGQGERKACVSLIDRLAGRGIRLPTAQQVVRNSPVGPQRAGAGTAARLEPVPGQGQGGTGTALASNSSGLPRPTLVRCEPLSSRVATPRRSRLSRCDPERPAAAASPLAPPDLNPRCVGRGPAADAAESVTFTPVAAKDTPAAGDALGGAAAEPVLACLSLPQPSPRLDDSSFGGATSSCLLGIEEPAAALGDDDRLGGLRRRVLARQSQPSLQRPPVASSASSSDKSSKSGNVAGSSSAENAASSGEVAEEPRERDISSSLSPGTGVCGSNGGGVSAPLPSPPSLDTQMSAKEAPLVLPSSLDNQSPAEEVPLALPSSLDNRSPLPSPQVLDTRALAEDSPVLSPLLPDTQTRADAAPLPSQPFHDDTLTPKTEAQVPSPLAPGTPKSAEEALKLSEPSPETRILAEEVPLPSPPLLEMPALLEAAPLHSPLLLDSEMPAEAALMSTQLSAEVQTPAEEPLLTSLPSSLVSGTQKSAEGASLPSLILLEAVEEAAPTASPLLLDREMAAEGGVSSPLLAEVQRSAEEARLALPQLSPSLGMKNSATVASLPSPPSLDTRQSTEEAPLPSPPETVMQRSAEELPPSPDTQRLTEEASVAPQPLHGPLSPDRRRLAESLLTTCMQGSTQEVLLPNPPFAGNRTPAPLLAVGSSCKGFESGLGGMHDDGTAATADAAASSCSIAAATTMSPARAPTTAQASITGLAAKKREVVSHALVFSASGGWSLQPSTSPDPVSAVKPVEEPIAAPTSASTATPAIVQAADLVKIPLAGSAPNSAAAVPVAVTAAAAATATVAALAAATTAAPAAASAAAAAAATVAASGTATAAAPVVAPAAAPATADAEEIGAVAAAAPSATVAVAIEAAPTAAPTMVATLTPPASVGASPLLPPSKRRRSERLPVTPQRARISLTKTGEGGGVATVSSPLRNSQMETCSICCEDTTAGSAVRLGCQHGWYCLECMRRHAEARLEVGAVDASCPECGIQLAECALKKLLPAELLDRFLTRSLEQAVSATADLCACPTPNCPMRVAVEEGGPPRLLCPMCRKTSCLRCRAQPYHRGLTCEQHAEKLRSKGRVNDDEESLRQWMSETGAKQCPTCKAVVTKQNIKNQDTQRSECHKMMCRNCSTRFCFKCLAVLTSTYTCGCTRDEHGFVDPETGKRVEHLKRGKRKR